MREGAAVLVRPQIFLNYRREDTRGYAGRLYDRLSSHFSEEQIFRDVDAIPPGIDYLDHVDQVVGRCDLMLVLIGESWSSVKDARGRRRLDNPRDLVRLEIAAALERGIPVIPVLLQGASMPIEEELPEPLQGLARRNALEMSDSHWNYDWERLTRALDQLSEPSPPLRKQPDDRERPPAPEPVAAPVPVLSDIPAARPAGSRWPIGRPVGIALAAVLPLLLLLTAGYLVARNAGSRSDGGGRQGASAAATSTAPTGTSATTTSHGMKAESSGMSAGGEFPDPTERKLLGFIPPSMRPACDRASRPLPGAVAAVRCFGNSLPAVQYNLFKTNDAMYRIFNERAKVVGAHQGNCNTTSGEPHLAKVTHDDMTVGSMICYQRGGEARLEWTNKSVHVYTYSFSKSLSRHDMYHKVYANSGPHSHRKAGAHKD